MTYNLQGHLSLFLDGRGGQIRAFHDHGTRKTRPDLRVSGYAQLLASAHTPMASGPSGQPLDAGDEIGRSDRPTLCPFCLFRGPHRLSREATMFPRRVTGSRHWAIACSGALDGPLAMPSSVAKQDQQLCVHPLLICASH